MGRNNVVGAWGESLAANYLMGKRYSLLSMNYRCRYGEIDLIVSNRKYLVFVEVKLRKCDNFASAMEHVDKFKQERLKKTALLYLEQFPSDLQPRFDVIEIYAPDGVDTARPKINHLEDAFS